MQKIRIHLYTGEGEGKTAAALGLALRSVGHKHKAVIIQFMKGRKWVGEYQIQEKLKPYYQIYQFGREEWVNLKHPAEIDKRLAKKGLAFAKKALKKKPELLVLEEINLAVAVGLLKLKDVVSLLKSAPEHTVIVLTGRNAPKKLIQMADLVTEMKRIKHPFEKGMPAMEGVEY